MVSRSALTTVRDRYERLPYPPPITDLDPYRDGVRTIDGCPRHFAPLYWPEGTPRADLDILVAGCGTSQAMKIAIQMPGARVVGIDLSRTSLDHTQRLADAYSVAGLELHQLPIEDVGTLDRQFDFVISTGVLHHLEEPDRGLSALREVLRPGGAMHLMVYATAGRVGLDMLRRYCAIASVTDDPGELDTLGTALESVGLDHPMQIFATRADDLADPAGRADALLHPVERTFSVDDVYGWLDRCGMQFVRWFHQAPYLARCGFPAKTPHQDRLAALPPREQHAAIELLRGTLITHAFAAVRADEPASIPCMDVDDADLPARRLIRFPGAVVDGTVLRNTAHREPDLPILADATALSLFEAVDGERTVADIIEQVGAPEAQARRQLVRFWEHDLVMVSA